MDSSADETAPPPGGGGGFFWRLFFEWRATYRPDEPRMSRWRWWVVFAFLPPIALVIIWSDKKFLKQMALIIFYMNTLLLLAYLFVFAYITNLAMPSWEVLRIPVMLGVAGILFGLLIAAYAQGTIIKAKEHVQDGADP